MTLDLNGHKLDRKLTQRGQGGGQVITVRTSAKDLMQISDDQAAFLAQKDLPGGKKTMKAYLWKVCGDAYDQQHGA